MTRPAALPVQLASIPAALRAEPRWVLWRYQLQEARWTKRPCQRNGQPAKTDDPQTWCTFEEAAAALGQFDGLGFALGNGWAGVDLDHAVDPQTGHWYPAVEQMRAVVPAYAEVSPSGDGVKLFGRSDRIGFEVRFDTGKVAPFNGARYFAVTGHTLGGDPLTDLTPLIAEWVPAAQLPPTPLRGFVLAPRFDDDALLRQIIGSDCGYKFLRLWRGDVTAYPSASHADMALCRILAFWTNGDRDRVDRLFRRSKLYRPKWDSHSYRQVTLAKAVQ